LDWRPTGLNRWRNGQLSGITPADGLFRDVLIRCLLSYRNLPPGSYRFEVQACNNDGVWSTTSALFAFVIAPHFHSKWRVARRTEWRRPIKQS